MNNRRLLGTLFALVLHPAVSLANVSFQSIVFGDNMVLQRQMANPIWGVASPGESVSVSFNGQEKSTTAAPNGQWRVDLDPMEAGGPFDLTVAGNNTLVLQNVLVGEVWLCSGQSNMSHFFVSAPVRAQYPTVRTVSRRGWLDKPSSVAFWFGVELQKALGTGDVPIGILLRAVSGSRIHEWLGPPDGSDGGQIPDWSTSGELYDRQIRPIQPIAFRGVAWWQGESDIPGPDYNLELPSLIESWRHDWGQGDVPFVYVALPAGGGLRNYENAINLPSTPPLPSLFTAKWTAFWKGLEVPATGMVTSVDIAGGFHPVDRHEYARRMVQVALANIYGQDFVYSGPLYESMTLEGNRIRLHFRHNTAVGLVALGNKPLQGFAISEDGVNFQWAQAEIQGEEVVVWNDTMPNPTTVQYAWIVRQKWANLFNGAHLGAAPFSTAVFP